MEKLALASESRGLDTKLSTIRSNGQVPAVVYGHKIAPTHITVNNSEFLKVFRKGGTTHLVDLTVDGKKQTVLIHDVQKHPVSGDFLHVDFFVVSASEKIHVQIPLHLVGESRAQKEGGLIEQNIHTIDLKCLAKDLVDAFEVDITALDNMGDIIHVSDLKIDAKKFDLHTALEAAVVSVHAPKGGLTEDEAEAAAVPAAEVPAAQDDKKETAE